MHLGLDAGARYREPVADDVLVYEEEDDSFYMGIDRTRDDRYIVIGVGSTVSDELRYAPADNPESFTVLAPRERRFVAVRGGEADDASREVIVDRGFGEYFTHRTGHSIDPRSLHGSGPHLDNLETREERALLPGVGFSIEPGIYYPGEQSPPGPAGQKMIINNFDGQNNNVYCTSDFGLTYRQIFYSPSGYDTLRLFHSKEGVVELEMKPIPSTTNPYYFYKGRKLN